MGRAPAALSCVFDRVRPHANSALGGVGIVNGAARERGSILERRRAEANGLALHGLRPIVVAAAPPPGIIPAPFERPPARGGHAHPPICPRPIAGGAGTNSLRSPPSPRKQGSRGSTPAVFGRGT